MTRASRLVLPLFLVAFCAVCAWVALGPPNPGAAASFEGSTYSTTAGVLATVALIAWIPVVVIGAAVLVMMGRASWLGAGRAEWTQHRRFQIGAVLVLGAVVLGVGMARHFEATPTLHGGSVARAQQLLKGNQ